MATAKSKLACTIRSFRVSRQSVLEQYERDEGERWRHAANTFSFDVQVFAVALVGGKNKPGCGIESFGVICIRMAVRHGAYGRWE